MANWAKQPSALKNRVLSPQQRKWSHFVVGARGETLAQRWLIQHGYKILAINLGFGHYEIDIVALDPQYNEVVFVEVKTRATQFFGQPSNAVGRLKLRSLNKAARQYLYTKGLHNLYRFDIISVTPQGVEHFENVSWP